jgi:hypothetical protein
MGKYLDFEGLKYLYSKILARINSLLSTIDASKITSGTISIDRLPAAALERLVPVANKAARLALTVAQVQDGDTVQEDDTKKMYRVVDDTKLTSEAGYKEFTAGSAASVPWSGVTDKPSTFTPSSHTHTIANVTNLQSTLEGKAASSHTHTKSQITDMPTSLKNPTALTIQTNGTSQGAYDGSAAKTVNITAANVGAAANSHTHTIANVTNLQTTLDGKAASSHTHTIANVTNLQSSLDGKSPTSHASTATTYGRSTSANYGHAMASGATPLVAGTAAVGTDNGKYAREGHIHPAQTTVSGNAGTATKLQTARTVAMSGAVTGTATAFDGSANITIPTTAIDVSKATAGTLPLARGGLGATTAAAARANLDAAATSHTHTVSQISNMPTSMKNPYPLRIKQISPGHLPPKLDTLYDGTYEEEIIIYTDTDYRYLLLSGNSANTPITGDIYMDSGKSVRGALIGNASTATTLQNARTLKVGDTGKSFNGSANVSWTLGEIGAAPASHTHAISNVTNLQTTLDGKAASSHTHTIANVTNLQSSLDGKSPTSHASTATTYGRSTATNYGHAMASGATPLVAGTAAVGTDNGKYAREGHVHPVQTTVSGNAGSATKLQTARTLTIGATGKSFNGSANVVWTVGEMGIDRGEESLIPFTFQGDYSHSGGTVYYGKNGAGQVVFGGPFGCSRKPNRSDLIGTLPPGYRPRNNLYAPLTSNFGDWSAYIGINVNGDVTMGVSNSFSVSNWSSYSRYLVFHVTFGV